MSLQQRNIKFTYIANLFIHALKMMALVSAETFVATQETKWCHNDVHKTVARKQTSYKIYQRLPRSKLS
jgi:hypothetical protein